MDNKQPIYVAITVDSSGRVTDTELLDGPPEWGDDLVPGTTVYVHLNGGDTSEEAILLPSSYGDDPYDERDDTDVNVPPTRTPAEMLDAIVLDDPDGGLSLREDLEVLAFDDEEVAARLDSFVFEGQTALVRKETIQAVMTEAKQRLENA